MKAHKWLAVLLAVIFILGLTGCSKPDSSADNGAEASDPAGGPYTVTFYSGDGTVLKIDQVAENAAARPPAEPQMPYGMVFKAWDTDFTAVTEDLEVRPVCEDTAEMTNVFAASGAYGRNGDTVAVPLLLCGDVCTAGFDATISYDPEKLELVSLVEDGAVVYNDETPGQIRLNYVSLENTTTDVDVCRMTFRIKAESGTAPVEITVHEIYACDDTVDSANDSLYTQKSHVINSQVFVIP